MIAPEEEIEITETKAEVEAPLLPEEIEIEIEIPRERVEIAGICWHFKQLLNNSLLDPSLHPAIAQGKPFLSLF